MLFAEFTDLLEKIIFLLNRLTIEVDDDYFDEIASIDAIKKNKELKLKPMSLATFFRINKLCVRNVSAPV